MEEKHYVYFIVHKEQNKRYYGVRTDKHLNTPDIFTGEYNTSSKDSDFVDEFTNHKDRFTITVEYFPTRISAEKQKSRKAEKFLLSVYDARNNPDFYNKWNEKNFFTRLVLLNKDYPNTYGVSWEQIK